MFGYNPVEMDGEKIALHFLHYLHYRSENAESANSAMQKFVWKFSDICTQNWAKYRL